MPEENNINQVRLTRPKQHSPDDVRLIVAQLARQYPEIYARWVKVEKISPVDDAIMRDVQNRVLQFLADETDSDDERARISFWVEMRRVLHEK